MAPSGSTGKTFGGSPAPLSKVALPRSCASVLQSLLPSAPQCRVVLSAQPYRDVRQSSLRRAIGVVPQDTVLFNETIRYNLLYGKPDATEAEVTPPSLTLSSLHSPSPPVRAAPNHPLHPDSCHVLHIS